MNEAGTTTTDLFAPGEPLAPRGSLVATVEELGGRARLCEAFDEVGAPLYDDCYGLDPHEIHALRSALAPRPGPVLELAAGNGRLTVPLLQMGREVTAVDLSEAMLAQLEDRVRPLRPEVVARLNVHRDDMTRLDLPAHLAQEYPVVVLLLASISILDRDGRVATLRRARERMTPDGALVLSVVVFRAHREESFDHTHEVRGRSGQPYRIHEVREAGSDVRQVTIVPLLDDPDATVPVAVGVHHVLDLDDFLAEVAEAGLRVRGQEVVESPDQGLAEIFFDLAHAG